MCSPGYPAQPNFVVIPVKLSNPSGLSWRVPNFNIRNRIR